MDHSHAERIPKGGQLPYYSNRPCPCQPFPADFGEKAGFFPQVMTSGSIWFIIVADSS